MNEKTIFVKDMHRINKVKSTFMIMKKLYSDDDKITLVIGDKTGTLKASLPTSMGNVNVGQVIKVDGKKGPVFEIKEFSFVNKFDINDFLPHVSTPIEEIMAEIDKITTNEIYSREAIELNNYFFKNEEFLEKFKKGIGGVSMHHNYRGGLAEHTLNVMYLSSILCHRYNCRRKETTILAAKLHDIGKVYEFEVDGPFTYTIRGELEGHIVIGVQMLDEAFRANPDFYSEDFKNRIKGCIVQHHGKLEYGSPREMKTEEAFIVNYADSIDATMNKISQIKEITEDNTWSEYDKRIDTKLYLWIRYKYGVYFF